MGSVYMNKKGFTLIELMAAIIIMALLTIVVTVNLSKTQQKSEQKRIAQFKQQVEDAACTFIDLTINRSVKDDPAVCPSSSRCVVTFDMLVNDGLLSSDLVNPNTGNKAINDNISVKITWSSGVKTCAIQGV